MQAEVAIAGAERGNWRDLRTVFEFAGITEPGKGAQPIRLYPSVKCVN
jgi:hypothetical protein